MSGDPQLIALPDSTRPLLEAAWTVLATPELPPVVLIGGLAVTTRVSATGAAHRATVDIDLVTIDAEPEAVEVLADAHATPKQPLIIGEVKVDLIATSPDDLRTARPPSVASTSGPPALDRRVSC